MYFNEETENEIDGLADEFLEAVRDERLVFFEGCTVVTAPTGAPPEYITVMVDGVNDPNVYWRGEPGGLTVGDVVLVWHNPISDRREIISGSGATATKPFVHDHRDNAQGGPDLNPETFSPQTFILGPAPCTYTTLGAAVAAVNAFGPTAANPATIRVQGIATVEAGDVTVPQYCHVEGVGGGSTIGMGVNTLILSSDTSIIDIDITSSDPVDALRANNVDNAVLTNVEVTQSAAAICFNFTGTSSGIECFECIAGSTIAGATGFSFSDTAYGHLFHCYCVDTMHISTGLSVTSTSIWGVWTRYCAFRAHLGGDDVVTGAGSFWYHLVCHFDPTNVTLVAGTHFALPTARFNQEVIVAEEGGDFQAPSEAVTWINAQGDAAADKLYGVLMVAGNYAEAGNVTIPQYVHVFGVGEGVEIEMGANVLSMSSDSSLQNVVVESSGSECVNVNGVTGVVLRNVKAIQGGANYCFRFHGAAGGECYHCIAETIAAGAFGFYIEDTSIATLWDCDADDATDFNTALGVDDTAECTTLHCRFSGATNDVWTAAGTTWTYHQDDFDYRNCTVGGTAIPADGQPVIWFDYTVAAANAAAITAAIDWVKGRTRVGDYTIDVAAGSHDVGLIFIDIPDEGGGNVILRGDTRVLAALSYVSGPQTAAAWVAATPYVAGNIVQPIAANNFYYKAQDPGTSAGAEPVWPTTLNATVIDNPGVNQITWICCGIPNNRAGLANGGVQDGVCMITSAAFTLTVTMTTQVTGVVSNPNFAADGWVNGDTLIAMDNAGAVAVHTVTGVAANVITIGAGAPVMGNLGTAFTLLPNRAIARTVAGPCVTNHVSGLKIDGIYLDTAAGADCHGVDAQNGYIELENVAIRAEDTGIQLQNDASVRGDTGALSLIDCYEGVDTNNGGAGAWVTYAIAYDIGHNGFRAVRGYIHADYAIVSTADIGYLGTGSEGIDASYAYALNCAYGFFAQFIGSVFAGASVAEGCTTAGYAGLYEGGMLVSGAAARNCLRGYWSYYNSYIFAGATNANNAGNTTNYSPAASDTEGNVSAIITWT